MRRRDAMRTFETHVWPVMERAERLQRRTHRLALATSLLAVAPYSIAVTRSHGLAQGLLIGGGLAIAFLAGRLHQVERFRRHAFRSLEVAHEHASLELALGDDDEA